MIADSADDRYTALLATLRQSLRRLAENIAPKVYDYGFLLSVDKKTKNWIINALP